MKVLATHLEREFGGHIETTVLYGSYARGDFDDESDVDVAVLLRCKRAEIHAALKTLSEISSEILLEYGILINLVPIPYDEFVYWKDTLPFYRNIDKEGVRFSA